MFLRYLLPLQRNKINLIFYLQIKSRPAHGAKFSLWCQVSTSTHMSHTHFFASGLIVSDILLFEMCAFQKVCQGHLIKCSLRPSKSKPAQGETFSLWNNSMWSVEIYKWVMTPFDGKCQHLQMSFSFFLFSPRYYMCERV